MFEISRRDLVLGSTAAGLVFGLNGPVAFIGAAQAQRAADSLKYKVGDIEAFSLHEGGIERPVTEAMVKNASLDDVKKALTAAGVGPDKIVNPFTVTAIRTGGKVILFDTGFGGNGPATVGKLADNMKAAGLDPATVSTVVISHFHGDHISGLWGEGDRRAGLPERGNHDARGGVQVLDRSGAGGEVAGGPAPDGQAHPGDLPDLEERQAVQ